ncbi:MAG: MscL family protein [Candidatus Omnitrophica bacterium]|nr:MscL family protein [Candidatus Omnitrophota bacterium]
MDNSKNVFIFKEKLKIPNLKEGFFKFLKTYGVLGAAIGIVMGQAVAKVINVLVEALIMPILGVVLPGNEWQDAVLQLGKVKFKIGLIIAATIDFLAISLAVILFVKFLLKIENIKKQEGDGNA